MGALSAAIDYMSAGRFSSALMKTGVKKEIADTISGKVANLFSKMQTSNVE